MKHFKHGKTKNTFQIQYLAMESKTSPWRTRNSVVSDAIIAKRTRRPQQERIRLSDPSHLLGWAAWLSREVG